MLQLLPEAGRLECKQYRIQNDNNAEGRAHSAESMGECTMRTPLQNGKLGEKAR